MGDKTSDIRTYFTAGPSKITTPGKRGYPSSSSDSDLNSPVVKPPSKRANTSVLATEVNNMPNIQEALDAINQRLGSLAAEVATKNDVAQMRQELKAVSESFRVQMDKLESRMMDIELKTDNIEKELKASRTANEELKGIVQQQRFKIREAEQERNEIQQYARRWNLRLYKVKEESGQKDEDCVGKACTIFTRDVGIKIVASDIEIAHRAGRPIQGRARPILIRFFDRKKRDEVIQNRRKLAGKGVTIDEDLTQANYKLSKAAKDHSATIASWSTNGKVLAKMKNGVVVRLNIGMNLSEVFQSVMKSGSTNTDQPNQDTPGSS